MWRYEPKRGGGNFAKAAAEVAGLVNATGSDARGFCAAPTHALIEAAALVKAGAYKTVVVTAGGCTAKTWYERKRSCKERPSDPGRLPGRICSCCI